jgi:hypothetical protein
MGELARRRRARDLWISRSHLWALGVGIVLLAAASFFLGRSLSRPSAGAAGGVAAESPIDGPDESLVDLLVRVDQAAVSGDGVDALTFPDALRGEAEAAPLPGVEASTPTDTAASAVAPGTPGVRPVDLWVAIPDGMDAAAVRVALAGAGADTEPWPGPGDDPGGAPSRLRVGEASDLASGEALRDRLQEALDGAGLSVQVELVLR